MYLLKIQNSNIIIILMAQAASHYAVQRAPCSSAPQQIADSTYLLFVTNTVQCIMFIMSSMNKHMPNPQYQNTLE
jgi:hypothetical protein